MARFTVAKRGWCLLNDKGQVVKQGNKAEIEKAVFYKVMAGHMVERAEQVAETETDDDE